MPFVQISTLITAIQNPGYGVRQVATLILATSGGAIGNVPLRKPLQRHVFLQYCSSDSLLRAEWQCPITLLGPTT